MATALEAAFEKFGAVVPESVQAPATVVDPVVTDPVDPADETIVDPIVAPVTEDAAGNIPPVEESEDDDFAEFFQAAGYVGEIKTIKDVSDLVKVAQSVRESFEAKVAVLETPGIKEVVEYLQAGGNLQDYNALPQPTNRYQDVEFADDAIADAEKFLADHFKELKTPTSVIPSIIAELKANGEIIKVGNEILDEKREEEAARNEQILAEQEEAYRHEIESQRAFLTELSNSYAKPLNGVTASKELVAEARTKSVPNARGVVEITEVYDKFTPQQHAVLNIAALAISQGKSFTYQPTKAVGAKPNPIDRIQVKAGGGGSSTSDSAVMTKEELETFARQMVGKR